MSDTAVGKISRGELLKALPETFTIKRQRPHKVTGKMPKRELYVQADKFTIMSHSDEMQALLRSKVTTTTLVNAMADGIIEKVAKQPAKESLPVMQDVKLSPGKKPDNLSAPPAPAQPAPAQKKKSFLERLAEGLE